MSNLRSAVIRLASSDARLRPLLLPLLRAAAQKAPPGRFLVELSAAPNYDFPEGSYQATMHIPAKFVPVHDMKGASRVVRFFISRYTLGAGNFTGGQILDDQGNAVAHVSYNGRVWEGPKGTWPTAEIHV